MRISRRLIMTLRARTRAVVAVLAVVVLVPLVAQPAGADHGDAAAAQAAREIQAARDRANAAAQALFDAESRIDTLDLEIAATAERVAALEAEVGEARTALELEAARRFADSDVNDIPLFFDLNEANDELFESVLSSVSNETAFVGIDDLEALIDETEEAKEELAQQQAEAERQREEFTALEAAAEEEIQNLIAIEEQRKIDEAVEHELERQRRERAAREAAEAEAAARAAANDGSGGSGGSGGGSTGGSDGGSTGDGSTGGSTGGSTSGGSGGSTGGSTGGSSGGSTGDGSTGGGSGGGGAPPTPPPPNPGGGMVCPIRSPYSFADTWGAPRSGGRSHQGVDMISPTGTPIIATVSGRVQFKQNRLGGNAVWLYGNDGNAYYYAHLSSFEGSSRSVSRGEVIGYNGQTGNAGTPHLHFEVHPGGGRAVNPYPYVRAVC